MKIKTMVFSIGLFFASSAMVAQATIIDLGYFAHGGNSSCEDQKTTVESATSLSDLLCDFKYNYPESSSGGSGTGSPSGGDYTIGDYSGTPTAFANVMWDLLDPAGYGLYAIAVKTANTHLQVYKVTGDDRFSGSYDVYSPPKEKCDKKTGDCEFEEKDSISHITFFVKKTDDGGCQKIDCDPPVTVPEPGTLALLGLGLVGLGLRRRKTA